MDASALASYMKTGDITGSLIELHADVQHLLWVNVALGTGLRFFNLRIEENKLNGSDEYEYNYWGPAASISTRL
jgi:hypothetical protein